MDLPGIVGKIGAALVANAIFFISEVKAMQISVFPAHHHIENMMQFSERRIAPSQPAPADLWADAQYTNLELIAHDQAVNKLVGSWASPTSKAF